MESINNQTVNSLTESFRNKDTGKTNYWFSIHNTIINQDGTERELLFVDKQTGADNFEKAVENAINTNPKQVRVSVITNKQTKRRKSDDYVVYVNENNEEEKSGIEDRLQALKTEMTTTMQDMLHGIDTDKLGESQLGMIQERMNFQNEKNQWTFDKQLISMQHEAVLNGLNRQIKELNDQSKEDKTFIQELETENSKWEQAYDNLQKGKISDYGKLASKIFMAAAPVVAKPVEKFLGLPSGTITAMGQIRTGEEGEEVHQQVAENEGDEVTGQIMQDTAIVLAGMDDEQKKKFHSLLAILNQDKNILNEMIETYASLFEGGGNG